MKKFVLSTLFALSLAGCGGGGVVVDSGGYYYGSSCYGYYPGTLDYDVCVQRQLYGVIIYDRHRHHRRPHKRHHTVHPRPHKRHHTVHPRPHHGKRHSEAPRRHHRRGSGAGADGGAAVASSQVSSGPSVSRPSGVSTQRPSGARTHRPSGVSTHRPSGVSTQRPSGARTHRPSGVSTHRPPRVHGGVQQRQRPSSRSGSVGRQRSTLHRFGGSGKKIRR